MTYYIKSWKNLDGVELAEFESKGQCVSLSPRPIAKIYLRGNVEVRVEAGSQHKAVSMAREIKELYS